MGIVGLGRGFIGDLQLRGGCRTKKTVGRFGGASHKAARLAFAMRDAFVADPDGYKIELLGIK